MKKAIAFVLCISILLGIIALTGCSVASDQSITKGEWISKLNKAFGMESYTETAPYCKNVNATSEYYDDTQIAFEWNVLNKSDTYNPNEIATKEFAIVTLINAGEFCEISLPNEQKIKCAAQYGFINDDAMLKIQLKKPLKRNDADELLNAIQTAWAEKTFDHVIEDIDFFDTIKDYSNTNSADIRNFKVADNKIYIPETDEVEIAAGDIYVLPATSENIGVSSYKAQKVEYENGYIVITNEDEKVDFEDIVKELKVEETFTPDLLSSGVAYDGEGNVITLSAAQNDDIKISNLVNNSATNDIYSLGSGHSGSIGFKKGDYEISGNITSTTISFTVKKKINESMKGFFGVSIDRIQVTNDIDFSWGKLHSATSKIDYKVQVTGGVEGEFYSNEYVLAPWHSNQVNHFIKNIKTAFYGGWKDKNAPGTTSINICSIPIASAGIVVLNLNVKVKITLEGTFEVEVTIDGTKGVQYKNGNVRWIKTNNVDVNAKLNAKLEVTPSVSFSVNILAKAVIGLGIDGGLGIQVDTIMHLVDTENHLIDTDSSSVPADVIEASVRNGGTTTVEEIEKVAASQGGTYKAVTNGDVKLHIDLCFNVKVYPILRFGIDEDTIAGKLFKGLNLKYNYEFFGSDDAFLNLHIENFSDLSSWERIKACNGKECTKEFTPFDNVEDINKDKERQDEKDQYGTKGEAIIDKDQLDISTYAIFVDVGAEKTINVIKIPKGYQLSEILCYSEDEKIATVDVNGTVKGISGGATTIIVETSDKKFRATCAVTVITKNSNSISPLPSIFYNDDFWEMTVL